LPSHLFVAFIDILASRSVVLKPHVAVAAVGGGLLAHAGPVCAARICSRRARQWCNFRSFQASVNITRFYIAFISDYDFFFLPVRTHRVFASVLARLPDRAHGGALVDVNARLPVIVQVVSGRAHAKRLAVVGVALVATAAVVGCAQVYGGAVQTVRVEDCALSLKWRNKKQYTFEKKSLQNI
jgi:hypothetical protein